MQGGRKMKTRFRKVRGGVVISIWGFVLGVVCLVPTDLLAFQIVPMEFEEMTAQAERIIVGVCTAKDRKEMAVGNDKKSNLAYTEYTFKVREVIKGNIGKRLKIRQVNLGGHPGPDGVAQIDPLPLPDYEVGHEVILFLAGDSTLGLTSPVGMDQAVFDVKMDGDHKSVIRRFDRQEVSDGHLSKWKLLDDAEHQDVSKDDRKEEHHRIQQKQMDATGRPLSSYEKFVGGTKKMVERHRQKE